MLTFKCIYYYLFDFTTPVTCSPLHPGTDLDEHEPLHGLHPLQQHDAGLEGSTQVLVARVRVTNCTGTTKKKEKVRCMVIINY